MAEEEFTGPTEPIKKTTRKKKDGTVKKKTTGRKRKFGFVVEKNAAGGEAIRRTARAGRTGRTKKSPSVLEAAGLPKTKAESRTQRKAAQASAQATAGEQRKERYGTGGQSLRVKLQNQGGRWNMGVGAGQQFVSTNDAGETEVMDRATALASFGADAVREARRKGTETMVEANAAAPRTTSLNRRDAERRATREAVTAEAVKQRREGAVARERAANQAAAAEPTGAAPPKTKRAPKGGGTKKK